MRWTNIEDSPPDEDVEYLLWDGDVSLIHLGFYAGKGSALREGFYKIGSSGASEKLEHITHYMEMPGAPP